LSSDFAWTRAPIHKRKSPDHGKGVAGEVTGEGDVSAGLKRRYEAFTACPRAVSSKAGVEKREEMLDCNTKSR
jgi:hypothetical protein